MIAAGPAKPTCGAWNAHEHTPGRTPRAGVAQIRDQGLADLAGQGEGLAPLAFAGHGHDAGIPIEIVERHRGHFTGAQPQPRQQQHDGAVAPSGDGARVAATDDRLHLLGRERLRHA